MTTSTATMAPPIFHPRCFFGRRFAFADVAVAPDAPDAPESPAVSRFAAFMFSTLTECGGGHRRKAKEGSRGPGSKVDTCNKNVAARPPRALR